MCSATGNGGWGAWKKKGGINRWTSRCAIKGGRLTREGEGREPQKTQEKGKKYKLGASRCINGPGVAEPANGKKVKRKVQSRGRGKKKFQRNNRI